MDNVQRCFCSQVALAPGQYLRLWVTPFYSNVLCKCHFYYMQWCEKDGYLICVCPLSHPQCPLPTTVLRRYTVFLVLGFTALVGNVCYTGLDYSQGVLLHWRVREGWIWQITLPDARVYMEICSGKKGWKMQVVLIIVDNLKWKTVYTSS